MTIALTPYAPQHAEDWDRLCAKAHGGTLMQTRRFLDYHGPRFTDLSLMAHRGGALLAVLPLAADPQDRGRIVSHPGTSFGGLITSSRDPALARSLLAQAARHLEGQGARSLLLRLPPAAVLRQPDDGLLPDLIRLGRIMQLDLWSVLTFATAPQSVLYWRSEIRRARRKGLTATEVATPQDWATLHRVLSDSLARRHGKALVHSLSELQDLAARLGPASRAHLIRDVQGQVLAGQWFLDYGTGVLHNQYNGATDRGLGLGAASYGIALALESARTQGFRAFSFGRSTNADGWSQNAALVRFKAGFGAGLSPQFHIEVPLDALAALGDQAA